MKTLETPLRIRDLRDSKGAGFGCAAYIKNNNERARRAYRYHLITNLEHQKRAVAPGDQRFY